MKVDTHINKMTIILDEPKMNFADIEYNALTLLVGANKIIKKKSSLGVSIRCEIK